MRFSDLRLAFRTLRRSPVFALSTVLTLTVSLGATTAIFTVVDGLLLAPLPYPQAERLVAVEAIDLEAPNARSAFAPAHLGDLRRQSRSFGSLAATTTSRLTLTGDGPAERLRGERVGGDYFEVMGVAPALGRTLNADDDRPGTEKVVVLGHGFWQRRYGGSRDVLGRRLVLDGESHTVVGVMPEHFGSRQDVFVPLALEPDQDQGFFLQAYARLNDGVSAAAADTEMRDLALRLAANYPSLRERDSVRVSPLRDARVDAVRPALLILQGAVAGLLLIACANVAALALDRALRRRRDMAVRSALGATRAQQARPVLAESALLVAAGTLGGLVLAALGTPALLAMSGFAPAPGSDLQVGVDARVIVFATVLALVAWILCVAPSLRATLSRLDTTLQVRGDSLRGSRMQAALVAGEVTLALALLVAAGLLANSLYGLLAVDPGFETRETFLVPMDLPATRYPDEATMAAFYHRIRGETEALPGVEQAAVAYPAPHFGEIRSLFLTETAVREGGADRELEAHVRSVSPNFFSTLGIPLRLGRVLDERDTATAPGAVVVNETAARRYWPGHTAVGARLTFDGPNEPRWWTVVGVVGDVRHRRLQEAAEPEIYRSIDQWTLPRGLLIVRGKNAAEAVPALRERVKEIDPSLSLSSLYAYEDLLDDSLAQPRFYSTLLGLFAGLSLLLAALGVFGLLSSSMGRRRRELAVRSALGASPRDVFRFALGRGLAPVVAGLATGLAAAFAASRLLTGLLFEVSPADPATFAAAVLTLLAIAAGAAGWPAWRASRIDTIAVLKEE